MSPNLGQGANSALVDAAVLLDELRRATDVHQALVAYERRRRPAVERVARLAHRLGVVSEETRAPHRWVRDRVLLPLARRLTGDPSTLLLQEDPGVLYAIGRN
jgi:2-polyprenyl-6-methoxyphenol hydroxylase-like FAD-dependent oxidoreductase